MTYLKVFARLLHKINFIWSESVSWLLILIAVFFFFLAFDFFLLVVFCYEVLFCVNVLFSFLVSHTSTSVFILFRGFVIASTWLFWAFPFRIKFYNGILKLLPYHIQDLTNRITHCSRCCFCSTQLLWVLMLTNPFSSQLPWLTEALFLKDSQLHFGVGMWALTD